MKKHLLPLILGLAGVFAIATAFGTGDEPLDEPEDDGVVLGEEDLAERGEILRNQFRRMTPGDEPLVQDIGTWPAAWEEFGTNWDSATADREYGAWVVPVELTQENGATVMKDGEGNELWRGTTDFARPESADVVLTSGLVAEEDWIAYEAVRGAVEEMTAEASRVDIPVPTRSHPTNGLRFTSCAWTTNDSFHMELAYEVDTNVDLFVYAVAHTSALVVATWTNDENVAVTDTNTVWYSVGEPFNGRDSTWEYLDTVAIDNGVAEYEDSGFPEGLGRLRYYAAAVAQDSDGDGLSDGQEAFISHTDHLNPDSDWDGINDGVDTFPSTSNVWFEVVTSTSRYYQITLDDVGLNAPELPFNNWSWIVSDQPPTSDSVVQDVHICGSADDYITVDTIPVNRGPGPRSYNQSIFGIITNLPSLQFEIRLVDWPDPTYFGANEVRLGTSQSEPFEVEWTWLVPMSLTGPEYMCVGNTSQFMAMGAGGGPYTWSVVSDGIEDVAEIDEDGILTALAPGIAFVTATAGETYSVSQAVNVVQIDFLTGDGNTPASFLKIGKWENAFTTGFLVGVKNDFIEQDSDRFRIRVQDGSQAGSGTVAVLLSTILPWGVVHDDETPIDLLEQPEDSGIFISTNQLLVVDDIDDDFANVNVPWDDERNDRTHRASLGGMIRVGYPEGEAPLVTKEISVAKTGTVHVIPIILDFPAGSTNFVFEWEVAGYLQIAQKRFAQVGIDLTWDYPVTCPPPAGVDLTDGLTLRTNKLSRFLTDEAKAAIAGVGTAGNTNDIHLIWVNDLVLGSDDPPAGSSVSKYWYSSPSEEPYLYNIFMNGASGHDSERVGGEIAHELGHLLGDIAAHAEEVWRLMHNGIILDGVKGSRRFVSSEETQIWTQGNAHVHGPE